MAVQLLGEILDKGTLDVYVRIMRFKEGALLTELLPVCLFQRRPFEAWLAKFEARLN